jgi:hypothetical protein
MLLEKVMATHLIAKGMRLAKDSAGKDMAYVNIHLETHDGPIKFEIGVPDTKYTANILEEVRQRLLILLQDVTAELESGPLYLQ